MMPDKNLPIYNCPVCARPSLECENSKRVSRTYSNSPFRKIKRKLFHYRTCHHCGIVFKVAKLETYLYRVIPANIWQLVYTPLPNSNWIDYPTNSDHNANYLTLNQNIRPACSKNLPELAHYTPSRRHHTKERPFQMEINCSEIGFHFAMIFDGIRDGDKFWKLLKFTADMVLTVADNFLTFLKAVFIDPLPNPKPEAQTALPDAAKTTAKQASLIITEIYDSADKATIKLNALKSESIDAKTALKRTPLIEVEELNQEKSSQIYLPNDYSGKGNPKVLILPKQ